MSDLRHLVHQPCELLRPYVREMLWITSHLPRTQVLLPETSFTLMLRQAGAGTLNGRPLANAILSGLQRRTRAAHHSVGSSILIVRFTEIGAAVLLRDRVDLLYNRSFALDTILPPSLVDRLQNQIADAPSPQQKFAICERFLLDHLDPQAVPSAPIHAAIQLIRSSQGKLPITAVAQRVAMSQSALERHFSAAVGASPKAFSRLVRLHHVCGLWDQGLSLTEIAHAAGYTDQPHFNRDFQAFTGTAPMEFLSSSHPRNLPTFYK